MSSARTLLEAAQQAPLRISDIDGSLSSLIVLEANNSWWNSVEKRLQATKRNVTLSLVAQMLVAAGAWVLTVAGSFIALLGDRTEALVLSSSALWTWLVCIPLHHLNEKLITWYHRFRSSGDGLLSVPRTRQTRSMTLCLSSSCSGRVNSKMHPFTKPLIRKHSRS